MFRRRNPLRRMYCTVRCSVVVRECTTKSECRSMRWNEWGPIRGKQNSHANRTILSAKLWSALPPPPNPLRALNMPGQRKQTKATMPSWMRGEAYQLVENLPILLDLYIHPAGRGMCSDSEEYCGGAFRSSIMNEGGRPQKNRR